MTSTGTDRTAREVLAELRARYPEAPFLALGQTVFWDEPVKAALRSLLDTYGLGGQMVVGVHDTDYFAKAHVRRDTHGRFALMPHNDGTTKNLWSAAGEISTLFGSETFPTRHDFIKYGVAFKKAVQVSGLERQAFVDTITEAWGWRGLVYTGARDLIVHRLPLREVGDGILEMLTWGFENALAQIVPGCCQDEARKVADTILNWCHEYRRTNPDKNLTQLFQHVLPRFYSLLLGHAPENITVDCTAHLLRLTPETASLPRFQFVNLFLDPATRETALAAYNQVVSGTEMYTLDKFGKDALPFDLVLPKQGRGTLRLSSRVLIVETQQPVAIGLKEPITSVQQLAEILTAKLGEHVTLVGKAITLVSMLAQEFIFVFNEEGSLYVRRTRQMNDLLAQKGISLDMRPILRMRYETWDALEAGCSTLKPAAHLAAAFGQPTIATPEFAATWRTVLEEQRTLCRQSAEARKPIELLALLHQRDALAGWDAKLETYRTTGVTLRRLHDSAREIQERVQQHYAELRALRAQTVALQHEQGERFRNTQIGTQEAQAERLRLEEAWRALAPRKHTLECNIRALKAQRLQSERGQEAAAARNTRAWIEEEAELARLHMVRNALLTIEGLTHTNHRPSAWWLPMVDSSGAWFRRIVETTTLYTEPLLT